ncbi:MAG: nuclear transport factor 2 family protein [Gemmatimonadetes bacterium]|nr:nuclear transport factor 2 family protein [Gemmatimonadota bacterium]MBK9066748.1 nuclear transport factor 2 family protein [Gemmatimonadota bacterium]MBK9692672.1 nuclear transport factor 2 family protein [Gemmatimonadota bacterium]
MRRLASTLLLALSLAACHGAAPASAPPPAGPRTELLRAMDASAAAWNRGDLDSHVALYTDSAAMMGKNGPIVGRAVIRGLLERGFWAGGQPAQQLAFDHLVVTMLGRDHAMLTGKCILTGGGKPDYTCRFTTIWEHTAAGWRIIHDHSS